MKFHPPLGYLETCSVSIGLEHLHSVPCFSHPILDWPCPLMMSLTHFFKLTWSHLQYLFPNVWHPPIWSSSPLNFGLVMSKSCLIVATVNHRLVLQSREVQSLMLTDPIYLTCQSFNLVQSWLLSFMRTICPCQAAIDVSTTHYGSFPL